MWLKISLHRGLGYLRGVRSGRMKSGGGYDTGQGATGDIDSDGE